MAVNNRMNRGCGWPTALCIHVFVLNQTMTASPHYFSGSMDGPSPDGRSAEWVIENNQYTLTWFGTISSLRAPRGRRGRR